MCRRNSGAERSAWIADGSCHGCRPVSERSAAKSRRAPEEEDEEGAADGDATPATGKKPKKTKAELKAKQVEKAAAAAAAQAALTPIQKAKLVAENCASEAALLNDLASRLSGVFLAVDCQTKLKQHARFLLTQCPCATRACFDIASEQATQLKCAFTKR